MRNNRAPLRCLLLPALLLAGFRSPASEPKVQLLLPLQRTAYQTNEAIELAVVRSAGEALPADTIRLQVSGEDGSALAFAFAAAAAPLEGAEARATDHLRLNG